MSWSRVFIAESMFAKDFYHGNLDGLAARHVLEIEVSKVQYRIVLDREHLAKAIKEASRREFDIFHLSCHGDDTGIQLTSGEEPTWKQLAKHLKAFARLDRGVVMASCEGGVGGLCDALIEQGAIFGWVFGAKDKPGYRDSCLAWSLLYRDLAGLPSRPHRDPVKRSIDRINSIADGEFVYWRWDKKKKMYIRYRGKSNRG